MCKELDEKQGVMRAEDAMSELMSEIIVNRPEDGKVFAESIANEEMAYDIEDFLGDDEDDGLELDDEELDDEEEFFDDDEDELLDEEDVNLDDDEEFKETEIDEE